MTLYKSGDAVWLYWNDAATSYPQMYSRPGVVTKKIHPTSYKVAFVSNDPRRPPSEWKIDGRSPEHHPTEMHPHDLDPGAELRRRRQIWKDETPADTQAAYWQSVEDTKRANERMNRVIGPMLARILNRG